MMHSPPVTSTSGCGVRYPSVFYTTSIVHFTEIGSRGSIFSFSCPHSLTKFKLFSISSPKRCCEVRRIALKLSRAVGDSVSVNGFCGKMSKISKFRKVRRCIACSRNVGETERNLLGELGKPLMLAILFLVIGLYPFGRFPLHAIAVPVVGVRERKENGKVSKELLQSSADRNEYSDCTRRLLETASELLRKIDDVRAGNGDMNDVKRILRNVKATAEELKDGILDGLQKELKVLEAQKTELLKKMASLSRKKEAMSVLFNRLGGIKGARERTEKHGGEMNGNEEYYEVYKKLEEIEYQIGRKKRMASSVAVRELSFIKLECQQLVENFERELGMPCKDSMAKGSSFKISKVEIQKDLEKAREKYWEQMILPRVVGVEDQEPFFNKCSMDFVDRLKQALKHSEEMQRNLEASFRKQMNGFGEERFFVLNNPPNLVVQGFPESELKWMFGNKEVVAPSATNFYLFHGWRKWCDKEKRDLKRSLLENVHLGEQYVTQRQENVISDRDKVLYNTWYSKDSERWEMSPRAVPFALSKNLIGGVRLRKDWIAMLVTLKGDDRQYYVDNQEYDSLSKASGGFEELYFRMAASDISVTVDNTWIPFSELDVDEICLLVISAGSRCLNALWKTAPVSFTGKWLLEKIRNINDDILMVFVFPVLGLLIPLPLKVQLGMAWPKEMDENVGSPWYMKWQSEVLTRFNVRKTDGILWYLWVSTRAVLYVCTLLYLFSFTRATFLKIFGLDILDRDPEEDEKLKLANMFFDIKSKLIKEMAEESKDPIKSVFDKMKRIKNPPIPLSDFANIEPMKEEIHEVVKFLQNPKAFEQLGARPPRGVLIVGEAGTGKTSLALAIAAESKVPLVKVEEEQLEGGLWVGQSAANVRELFQTARDLAPVIIYVEDFDRFAGVRGKYIHTEQQDHEAFINQLLVELDGFEKQDGVVLMATTRSIQQIDQALQRPGRMDRIFHLQRPTLAEREKILLVSARESMYVEHVAFVDWKKVAEKTALLPPVDLKRVPISLEVAAFRTRILDEDELFRCLEWCKLLVGLVPDWFRKTAICKRIEKKMVDYLGLTLTKADLEHVVQYMEPFGETNEGFDLYSPMEWTMETKFPHAVWAAGRGLIAVLLPNFDVIDNIWIEPSSSKGVGFTKFSRANDGGVNGSPETKSYLEKKLVFCFGSHVAAELLLPFEDENILSQQELENANTIASRMVVQYGWRPDDNPTVYLHGNTETTMSMGDTHMDDLLTQVQKLFYIAYERAREILQKNYGVLKKVVDALLEVEMLTGEDLERLIDEYGGMREEEPFYLVNPYCGVHTLQKFLLDETVAT